MDAREVGHGLVGELLHPRLEGVGALDPPRGVVVQDLLGFLDRGAGPDFLGHPLLLGDQAVEFLHAPGVRFLEVHRGAQEGAGGQRVAFAADGVLLGGDGQQFGLQESGQPGVGHPCGGSAGVEPGLHVAGQRSVRGLGAGGQLREEAVLGGVLGGLLDDDFHLPCGGHLAVLLGGAQ